MLRSAHARLATTDARPPPPSADTVVVGAASRRGRSRTTSPAARCRRCVDAGEARRALAPPRRHARRRASAGSSSGSARATTSTPSARASRPPSRAAARASSARGRCAGRCPTTPATTSSPALVEGTVLADYRFDALPVRRPTATSAGGLERARRLSDHHDRSAAPSRAPRSSPTAVNRARDLQNTPAERPDADGARRARAGARRARRTACQREVERRARRSPRAAMGAFAAVAQGSRRTEPALITLRYERPRRGRARCSALVGKAVTFDSGGISIKPAASMAR